MTSGSKTGFQLTETDRAVFDHIFHYRIGLPDVIHRLVMPDQTKNSVYRRLSKLRKFGYLRSYDLYEQRHYYRLSPSLAAKRYDMRDAGKPHGNRALVKWLGVTLYCASTEPPTELIPPPVFRKHFSGFCGVGATETFFLDQERRLGYIRVDRGGRKEYVAKRCLEWVQKKRTNEAFRTEMNAGRVFLVVVTYSEPRQKALDEVLRDAELAIPHHVDLQPALDDCIFNPDRGLARGGAA